MNSSPRAVPVRDRFYARSFALATTAVLGYAFFRIVQPFLGPLLWALFLAFLLHPLHVRLTTRLKRRPQTVGVAADAPDAGRRARSADGAERRLRRSGRRPAAIRATTVADQTESNVFNLTNVPWVRDVLGWLDSTFDINLAQVRGWIIEGSRSVLQSLASLGGKVFLGAVGTVVGFVLMVFMLFFFIRDGEEMVATARELIPMSESVQGEAVRSSRRRDARHGVWHGPDGADPGRARRHRLPDRRPALAAGVRRHRRAVRRCCRSAARRWSGSRPRSCSRCRAAGARRSSCWSGARCSSRWSIMSCGRCWCRAAPHVGTLTVFIGVLGGIAAFGAIGLFLGPVVLALIIALIRFMLEIRRAEARLQRQPRRRSRCTPSMNVCLTHAAHRDPAEPSRAVAGRARGRAACAQRIPRSPSSSCR